MKRLLAIALMFAISSGLLLKAQNNVAKLGVTELLIIKPSLQYERVIGENSSLNVTLNYRPEMSVPSVYYQLSYESGEAWNLTSNSFAIIPEFRFYTGFDLPPDGFYIAIQARYATSNFLITNKLIGDLKTNVEGDIQSVGAGVQIGKQWLVTDFLTIDFYFAGITLQKITASGEFTAPNENISMQQLQTNMEDSFSGYSFYDNNVELTEQSDNVKAETSFIFPNFRFGVSLGFAF